MTVKRNRIWTVLFVLYNALMLWLLFHRTGYVDGIPYGDQLKMNLLPFQTIRLFLGLLNHPNFRRDAVINLVGNIVMFIPLGFLLPKVFPKLHTLRRTLLAAAVIIIIVELAQLLTLLGSCDTDDLILNLLGAALGYGIYRQTKL